MKASQQRKLLRWMHILLSIPIIGFIYGPVSQIPVAVIFVRWAFVPAVTLSGFWMWKGQVLKKWWKKAVNSRQSIPK
ncbi:MAG: hypothetical protein IT249_08030 [Chitinophagaceae bacterium]|nr:hypothetical protein [Chitinophagaceae bacterium]